MIEDCVIKGYVRMFIKEEVVIVSKIIWFLFYYLVSNLNKLGKVRVMFDVVVRFSGIFLNE